MKDELFLTQDGNPMVPDFAQTERMMFQLSLRRRGISDQSVLKAMDDVPRDRFVTPADHHQAWRDTALGIACGQTISQPFVVAYMTEQLQLRPTDRVLEIGTGSGYQAAILSRLVKTVLSVERFSMLADAARALLEKLGCLNVEVMVGDGYSLPDNLGTFDRIICHGSNAGDSIFAVNATERRRHSDRADRARIRCAETGTHRAIRRDKHAEGFARRAFRAGIAGRRQRTLTMLLMRVAIYPHG